jgi:ABC-2 type transport system permease protein
MNHILQVFLYELRRNLRRKAFLATTFGVPLIGFLLMLGGQLLMSSSGMPRSNNPMDPLAGLDLRDIRTAGYVDDSGLYSDPGDLSSIFRRYPDEDAALAALNAGEVDVYYVIADDYLETGDVTLVVPRVNIGYMETNAIRRLLLNELAQEVGSPALFERLVNPARFDEIQLQPDQGDGIERTLDASLAIVYIFAILLLMSLFVTNGYLMQSVIEEKETRLIEILLSSLRPFELLAGKILALGLLGLLQIVVWLSSILFLSRLGQAEAIANTALSMLAVIRVPDGTIPLILVYFVLSYLMFAAFYSIVGALSNSMREGPQYAVIFTLPAVSPLWFTQLFITDPNGTIPTILSIFPLTAPLSMIQRFLLTTVPTWEIVASVALLALTVVATMALASRLFRVQTLLAGQPLRLRDVPKLVRG